jgi:hypothetical protein
LPVAGSFRIVSDECSARTMVILTPGKGSMVPPLFMRGTSLAGIRPSVRSVWSRPAGAYRHVVGLGEFHGVTEMIAVAMRHQDQVDLAELA